MHNFIVKMHNLSQYSDIDSVLLNLKIYFIASLNIIVFYILLRTALILDLISFDMFEFLLSMFYCPFTK